MLISVSSLLVSCTNHELDESKNGIVWVLWVTSGLDCGLDLHLAQPARQLLFPCPPVL
ncbi:mCG64072, isoform CRA_a [Mus musculus]|nr:mCG64072, isoform CRA_a [Mus musculus]EDL01704.1 mCG64072, isoform CRA_a [Mus musculus]